jgi:NADH-quinone oxidoreductase subunit N
MKYLLTGAFATGFIVFGIALTFGATGTSNLFGIAEVLSRQTLVAEDRTLLLAGAAMILVGFGYKISLVPFHMWTPDVYVGAPTPVTAFMSVGSKAAVFAALTRFLLTALETQRDVWAPALAGLAALTIIVGTVTALTQRNVKRMLAYSSVAQAGFMLLGVLGAPEIGPQSLLFYLLAYAFSNLCSFGVLIALERRGEAAWDLDDLSGLWERHRGLAVAMAIGVLSLAGVPPTAGFFAKFYVLMAAWQGGMQVLALIGIVASAVSAFFYLRIATQMFMGEPGRAAQVSQDRWLGAGVAVVAAAILVLGILPTSWLSVMQTAVLAAGAR